ncbi:MAG: hypothetical protein GF411_19000 [Candidatus Lokiarchaeota archaeon]|nr:hypothetical protein [Candidatus Lokiarchaeota archaeon]
MMVSRGESTIELKMICSFLSSKLGGSSSLDFLYGGNWVSDTVIISVHDTTIHTINQPPDNSYEYSTTGNELTWIPVDLNPASYTILRNNTSVESQSWNGSIITVSFDGLSAGVYNFTIIVYDAFYNSAVDTVIVTVTDPSRTPITVTSTTTTTQEEVPFDSLIPIILGISAVLIVVMALVLRRSKL